MHKLIPFLLFVPIHPSSTEFLDYTIECCTTVSSDTIPQCCTLDTDHSFVVATTITPKVPLDSICEFDYISPIPQINDSVAPASIHVNMPLGEFLSKVSLHHVTHCGIDNSSVIIW